MRSESNRTWSRDLDHDIPVTRHKQFLQDFGKPRTPFSKWDIPHTNVRSNIRIDPFLVIDWSRFASCHLIVKVQLIGRQPTRLFTQRCGFFQSLRDPAISATMENPYVRVNVHGKGDTMANGAHVPSLSSNASRGKSTTSREFKPSASLVT